MNNKLFKILFYELIRSWSFFMVSDVLTNNNRNIK